MNAFNQVNQSNEYSDCKDSTKVFTIKVVIVDDNKSKHSCDFAIIYDCPDGRR